MGQQLDAFEARAIMVDLVDAAKAEAVAKLDKLSFFKHIPNVPNVDQDVIEAVTASSIADFQKQEERQLQQALAASVGVHLPSDNTLRISPKDVEEKQLAEALAVSAASICQHRANGGFLDSGAQSAEDRQLQEILDSTRKDQLRYEEADLQAAIQLSRTGKMVLSMDVVEVMDSASESEVMLGTPEPKRHRAQDRAMGGAEQDIFFSDMSESCT